MSPGLGFQTPIFPRLGDLGYRNLHQAQRGPGARELPRPVEGAKEPVWLWRHMGRVRQVKSIGFPGENWGLAQSEYFPTVASAFSTH